MRILTSARLIRPYQLNANQTDVVTAVINEIPGGLVLRGSGQLIVSHHPVMLPVQTKDVSLPHMGDSSRTTKICDRRR